MKGGVSLGPEQAIHRQWLLAAPCPLFNLPPQRSNPLPTVSKSRIRVSSVLGGRSLFLELKFGFSTFCV